MLEAQTSPDASIFPVRRERSAALTRHEVEDLEEGDEPAKAVTPIRPDIQIPEIVKSCAVA